MESPQSRTVLKYLRMVFSILFSILFYAVVAVGIGAISTRAYDFTYAIFGSQVMEAKPGHDVEFTIKKGETTSEVAGQLELSRLVANRQTFYIRAKLTSDESNPIMPGTYRLNTSMNYQEILDVITDSTQALEEEDDEGEAP